MYLHCTFEKLVFFLKFCFDPLSVASVCRKCHVYGNKSLKDIIIFVLY